MTPISIVFFPKKKSDPQPRAPTQVKVFMNIFRRPV